MKEQSKTIVVHTFRMGDVDDPDLYAAVPILKWEKSEVGTWVMERAAEVPSWHRRIDPFNYGYTYEIRATLSGQDLTFFNLKWGGQISL